MDNGNAVQSLIEELYELISGARWFPVGQSKCIVDRTQALDIIDQIRTLMPREIAEAQRLVAGRMEFITNAKREAETIRRTAEERSRQLVDEQEVLRIAKAESRDLMANATGSANELRRSAARFVGDTLRESETALSEALKRISVSREQFDSALSGVPGVAAPELPERSEPAVPEAD
ncbi:MAG: hypothetical protein LBS90_07850 [Oscillospiraceae bacterium]|jgi:hypothetical protein|nr:hypothetical protein [Oscillospiraceae bacterium]